MFVGTILALTASKVIKIRPLWGRLYEHGKGTGNRKGNMHLSTNTNNQAHQSPNTIQ
jgi:hypothetical protein